MPDKSDEEPSMNSDVIGNTLMTEADDDPGPLPYLVKVAVVRLQHTQEHLVAFLAYTRRFEKIYFVVKAIEACNPKMIEQAVRRFDFYYPDLPHLIHECARVAACEPSFSDRGLATVTGGWVDEGFTAYVFGDRVIGNSGETGSLVVPVPQYDSGVAVNLGGRGSLPPECQKRFRVRGTRQGWKEDVALEATCSSAAMIAICAAFAAPLISLTGAEPFVILFADETTSGKSTAELIGASVIGIGEVKLLPRWKGTEAGIEGLAQDFAHMYFPIDDLSHVGAPKKILERIDQVAYWMNSGGIQHKHERAAERVAGRPIPQNAIAAIMVTSCEKSIAEMERLCSVRLNEGAEMRILELPAAAYPNSQGVVDRLLPENLSDRANFAIEWIANMRATCAENHGKIYLKWLRMLIDDRSRALQFINERRPEFRRAIGNPLDNKARRAAKHFELLYAGGAYAIDRSLLEWSRKSLFDVCVAYWNASLTRRQNHADAVKK
jgi:hypothetical protein